MLLAARKSQKQILTSSNACRIIGIERRCNSIRCWIDGSQCRLQLSKVCFAHDDATGVEVLLNERRVERRVEPYTGELDVNNVGTDDLPLLELSCTAAPEPSL